jgi:hypothetical protein
MAEENCLRKVVQNKESKKEYSTSLGISGHKPSGDDGCVVESLLLCGGGC